MSNIDALVDDYIALWNETDGPRRRDLIARVWTEDASFVDPMVETEGRAGIDALVASIQERFPGHRFRRKGTVDSHHDRIRFCWELLSQSGPVVAAGTDVAILAGDARMRAVTGFFDGVTAASAPNQ
jgi:hypothetical protein